MKKCDLSYCGGGNETFERLRALYEKRDMSLALASFHLPSAVKAGFAKTREKGFCDYPDPEERIRFWDAVLLERRGIADDSVPSVYLTEMDQGLYGGLLGGKTMFLCDTDSCWISSMVEPILSDLSELPRLKPDFEGEWARRYRRQLEVFHNGAVGKFGVSHFILIDGLNFLFELVGAAKTYEELLDRPALVREAIEFAFRLNVKVQEMFFEAVPLAVGGTSSFSAAWVPDRIVAESIDPFHMTSVEYLEEWGREPIERIFAHFDGGILHIHGNGRHLIEAAASLRGLKAIQLGDDRGYPMAFDILPELRKRAGDMPLIAYAPYAGFMAALRAHALLGGVFYQVGGAPDIDAANRSMEMVRAYRV